MDGQDDFPLDRRREANEFSNGVKGRGFSRSQSPLEPRSTTIMAPAEHANSQSETADSGCGAHPTSFSVQAAPWNQTSLHPTTSDGRGEMKQHFFSAKIKPILPIPTASYPRALSMIFCGSCIFICPASCCGFLDDQNSDDQIKLNLCLVLSFISVAQV